MADTPSDGGGMLLLQNATDKEGLSLSPGYMAPAGDLDGMRRMPERVRKRAAADESLLDARDALGCLQPPRPFGILNIKLMKCGGITPAMRIAHIAETAGIGQGDSKITDLADISIYVMTSDYGAPSQLEKIDMLDYADIIVINKFEKKGSDDAIRDIRKQVQRNRTAFDRSPDDMPVFGTIASKFNDDGVTALYHGIADTLRAKGAALADGADALVSGDPRALARAISQVERRTPAGRPTVEIVTRRAPIPRPFQVSATSGLRSPNR